MNEFPNLVDGQPTRLPDRVSSQRRTKVKMLQNLTSSYRTDLKVEDHAVEFQRFLVSSKDLPSSEKLD